MSAYVYQGYLFLLSLSLTQPIIAKVRNFINNDLNFGEKIIDLINCILADYNPFISRYSQLKASIHSFFIHSLKLLLRHA